MPVVNPKSGSMAVYYDPSSPAVSATFSGSMGVYFDPSNPAVTSYGLDGTTKRPLRMNSDGAIKVYDIADGSVSISNAPTITGITNSIAAHILSTNGTIAVNVGKTDGTVTVRLDPGYTLGNVYDLNKTATAYYTASGSASGVSVSGNTVISPTASRNAKVYAISLMTTAQVHLTARWTNGAGTGPTEFWRGGFQAPSQGIAGMNLAVTPPGYLFATGTNVTLALLLNSASLVHYSVAYFKETA